MNVLDLTVNPATVQIGDARREDGLPLRILLLEGPAYSVKVVLGADTAEVIGKELAAPRIHIAGANDIPPHNGPAA